MLIWTVILISCFHGMKYVRLVHWYLLLTLAKQLYRIFDQMVDLSLLMGHKLWDVRNRMFKTFLPIS